jgi:predicted nucleotidyltransferase component of viral defense system
MGLILQAQSREEILADKVIALAFRENRIKHRDLWDIAWLVQQGVVLPAPLIPAKIADRQRELSEFVDQLRQRVGSLKTTSDTREEFLKEMRRFLPAAAVRDTLAQPAWWGYLTSVIDEQARQALSVL